MSTAAFPRATVDGGPEGSFDAGADGMTLRQYVAAKVLPTLITSDSAHFTQSRIVSEAFLYADEFIKQGGDK